MHLACILATSWAVNCIDSTFLLNFRVKMRVLGGSGVCGYRSRPAGDSESALDVKLTSTAHGRPDHSLQLLQCRFQRVEVNEP